MLVMAAPDMVAYEAITRRFFAQNDAVTSFQSLVALDPIKAAGSDLAIPELWRLPLAQSAVQWTIPRSA